MGNLSKNFSRHEFECKCGCGSDTIDFMLLTMMQGACDYFEKVLGMDKVTAIVTSGNRCDEHNRKELEKLGLPDNNSLHKYWRAADFRIKGVTARELYNYLDKTYGDSIGLGLYSNRVHLDSRGRRARWDATKN